MVRCVGIDLAWSPRNNSGGFALQVGNGVAGELAWHDSLGSDRDILEFVGRTSGPGPALVAVDAPITVPNERGARPCDRDVTRVFGRFQAGAHPANRRILGRYGDLRPVSLARRLGEELGFAQDPYITRHTTRRQLVEVYPHPGMVALFGLDRTLKYKRGTVSQRRSELKRLQCHLLALASAKPALEVGDSWRREIEALRGRELKQYEDLLDSLFCAYTVAYCWHHGSAHYQVFGNVRDGHILVPVPLHQRARFNLPVTRPR